MRRLAVLLMGCQTVFAPFDSDGGGGTTGATTVIGGTGKPDLSTPVDGSASTTLPSGTVRVHSGTQSSVRATFVECPALMVSGCVFRDCAPTDLAAAAYTANVGTLHVVTPSVDLTLAPASDGVYLPLVQNGPLWSLAGAPVAISASGADFSPFAISLDGPTAVTVTNPLAGSLDVPRTADLSLSWTGGTTGHVTVEIVNAMQSLSCDFAVAAAGALVPRQALSKLSAGAATLSVVVASTAIVDAVVQVRAEVSGEDVGGMPFVASVNLR